MVKGDQAEGYYICYGYSGSISILCPYLMKRSNDNKSETQRKRAEKNKERISDKPYLSKHQRWELRERLRIISESLSKF